MSTEFVRRRWADGRPARLAWSGIDHPQVVETVALSGAFDAVVLDLQHGTYDRAGALAAARAAARTDVTLLARIASVDADLIGWLLDIGVDGLIVAMCESTAQVSDIVRAVRYPPHGDRSYGVVRATSPLDAVSAAEQVIVLPMIESAAGLAAVESIVAVEGVDGVFIGPGDLGQSLGHGLGQDRTEPEMVAAFDTVRMAAHAAGKRCGIFAVTSDYARECAEVGYDLVVPWFDSAVAGASIAAAVMP
jgi:4-hydroxy-2-oxoheptanedioate aldolase